MKKDDMLLTLAEIKTEIHWRLIRAPHWVGLLAEKPVDSIIKLVERS